MAPLSVTEAMLNNAIIDGKHLKSTITALWTLIINGGNSIRQWGIKMFDDTNINYECFFGMSSGFNTGGSLSYMPRTVMTGNSTASFSNNFITMSGRTNNVPWALCVGQFGGLVVCSRFSSLAGLVEPGIILSDTTLGATHYYCYFNYLGS